MEITTNQNRISVSFNYPNTPELANAITEIVRKYNAQDMRFRNHGRIPSGLTPAQRQKYERGIVDVGGTITFHEHSCNPTEASNELIELLKNNGI